MQTRTLVAIIEEQTAILLHNAQTSIQTCDLDYVLCDMPVWKHLYHALHSLDQWFINPQSYQEPPFHEPHLNSLDHPSERRLTREELFKYFKGIRLKINRYLQTLTDGMLSQKPEKCPYTRLALLLGGFRHLYCHMGNINATTMMNTGRWPRVVGLNGDLTKGLYE